MPRELQFYTDGAYSSKTEMGGWAMVCVEDETIIDEQKGCEAYTTNNRVELMGFLAALEDINQIKSFSTKVSIFTDSAYIANCINDKWYQKWLNNGWKTADKQDVKNQDLWSRIIALYIKLKERFSLTVVKVEAHKENRWNNYVDEVARSQRHLLEKEEQH